MLKDTKNVYTNLEALPNRKFGFNGIDVVTLSYTDEFRIMIENMCFFGLQETF